jgi:hypothetical protein
MRDEALAVAWVRLELMQARCAEALAVADAWHDFTVKMKAIRSTLRWEVLRAKILLVSGDQRGAKRELRRAVTTAAPRCYIRSLINEGNVITELLKEIYFTDSELHANTNGFIGRLLEASGTSSAPQPLVSSGLKDSVNAPLDAREGTF